MVRVHELSRTDARRIAVRAQLLAKDQRTDVLDTVRHLTLLQVDQTSAVAPSVDLVLWSWLGPAYSSQDLRDAVDEQRLVELRGALRPVEDLVLHRAEMAERLQAAVHRDLELSATMTAEVDPEIRALARWLELDLVLPG